MGVPKRKVSKARYRTRRMANRYHAPQLNLCSHCGAAVLSHHVCPSCGYYKERQIIRVELK